MGVVQGAEPRENPVRAETSSLIPVTTLWIPQGGKGGPAFGDTDGVMHELDVG